MSTSEKLTEQERVLLEKMISGELSLRKIEEAADKVVSAKIRRAYLETQKNVSLDHISNFTFDADQVGKKNIENMIGAVQMPLGV
ncbi:MAG: 3-hydroxy-3-methylglutaryl-CoA reductase, partial [Methanimicrococcus sp.]|nr:3-hydroxy-3-methylglutaryl-CoA reductase [Methanimicrococcus sp.]